MCSVGALRNENRSADLACPFRRLALSSAGGGIDRLPALRAANHMSRTAPAAVQDHRPAAVFARHRGAPILTGVVGHRAEAAGVERVGRRCKRTGGADRADEKPRERELPGQRDDPGIGQETNGRPVSLQASLYASHPVQKPVVAASSASAATSSARAVAASPARLSISSATSWLASAK